MPFGGLLHLAALLVLVAIGGRQADIGHGVAAGQVAGFRVCAEVADENDFVDRCHEMFSKSHAPC
ncbi:hypothetical protein D3C87_1876090 [compost metagenome]